MANTKSYTNLEQSKKLIELGIDINTADIWWAERYEGRVTEDGQYIVAKEPYCYLSLTKPSDTNYSQDTIKDIPAWSLSALMELTPNDVSLLHLEDVYQAVYDVKPYHITNRYDNPLDAAFEMIYWLKENGKI